MQEINLEKVDHTTLIDDIYLGLLNDNKDIDKYDLGRSFYLLGKLYYDKADLDQAEVYFLKSLELSEKPRDTFSLFKIFGFLIRIASEKLENTKATQYIAEAQMLIKEFPILLGSLNAEYFYNLGIVNNYLGEFESSKTNFSLALKRAREENEPDLASKCLLALAVNCYTQKEYSQSLEHLESLNDLLRILDKSYLKGAMYLFSAKVYTELGIYEKAIEKFDLANEKLQEKKCWNMYGYMLLGRGIVAKRMGQFALAEAYFKLAINAGDGNVFKRLNSLVSAKLEELNDNTVDLYLDKVNRKVKEREIGLIDFKHRFILLEILFLLAKNAGEYYDKDALAKQIWKDEYNPLIHDKLIYTSVSRLRKLIEPKNDRNIKRKYIIRGKDGYTFNPLSKIRFCMEQEVSVDDHSIANVEISSPV